MNVNYLHNVMQDERDELKIQLYMSLIAKTMGTLEHGEANLIFHLSKEPAVQTYLEVNARKKEGHKTNVYAHSN